MTPDSACPSPQMPFPRARGLQPQARARRAFGGRGHVPNHRRRPTGLHGVLTLAAMALLACRDRSVPPRRASPPAKLPGTLHVREVTFDGALHLEDGREIRLAAIKVWDGRFAHTTAADILRVATSRGVRLVREVTPETWQVESDVCFLRAEGKVAVQRLNMSQLLLACGMAVPASLDDLSPQEALDAVTATTIAQTHRAGVWRADMALPIPMPSIVLAGNPHLLGHDEACLWSGLDAMLSCVDVGHPRYMKTYCKELRHDAARLARYAPAEWGMPALPVDAMGHAEP